MKRSKITFMTFAQDWFRVMWHALIFAFVSWCGGMTFTPSNLCILALIGAVMGSLFVLVGLYRGEEP